MPAMRIANRTISPISLTPVRIFPSVSQTGLRAQSRGEKTVRHNENAREQGPRRRARDRTSVGGRLFEPTTAAESPHTEL